MSTVAESDLLRRLPYLLLGLALLYVFFTFFRVLTYPLAMAPQLDAAENLILAQQIQTGELVREPFYRAMLYPWILSLVTAESWRPQGMVVLGLVFHLLSSWWVACLAGKVWGCGSARWVAGIGFLIYPPVLFYSLLGFDIALGICLALAGIRVVWGFPARARTMFFGGALVGAAILARPHFLPLAIALPVAVWYASSRNAGSLPVARLSWLVVGLIAPLLLQGGINLVRSGQLAILPTQGGFNLYAANRPGSHGLYFQQTVDVAGRNFLNPARAESEQLWQEQTGRAAPEHHREEAAHWRSQFWKNSLEDPRRMVGLVLFKAYAVLNSHEQYNNLTYSFHRQQLAPLRYNPWGWGFLLLAGAIGALTLWQRHPRRCTALLLLCAAYASTLVVYYASARFRLPLVPFLAILAGGLPLALGTWSTFTRRQWIIGMSLLAGLTVLTFSSWKGVRQLDTHLSDQLLLANAHATLGEDREAAKWSREVLARQPQRQEALRTYAISYFNLRLTDPEAARIWGDWKEQEKWVTQAPPTDPVQDAILGFFYWNWGRQEEARQLWRDIIQTHPLPLADAALAVTGPSQPPASRLTEAIGPLLKSKPSDRNRP